MLAKAVKPTIIIIALILIPIGLVVSIVFREIYPTVVHNVSEWHGLPVGAKNIYVRESSLKSNIRFSISESEFLDWVQTSKVENKGCKQVDGTYLPYIGSGIGLYIDEDHHDYIQIPNGIWIANLDIDSGGVIIVFDKDTNMCYYTRSSN